MKLSKAESKALKFVVFIVALSAFARWRKTPDEPLIDSSSVMAAEAPKAPASSGPLDLNTASVAELDRLPGVGRATAQKLVTNRPYQGYDDLVRVVGKQRAGKIAPLVGLTPAGNSAAGPVDMNNASAAELTELPGVGPSLARRIIARRDSVGGFQTWQQLDSVRGIGPALLTRIKERARL